jgi:hypothetical protein
MWKARWQAPPVCRERLHVVTYRAILDVSRDAVLSLSRPLPTTTQTRGAPRRSSSLLRDRPGARSSSWREGQAIPARPAVGQWAGNPVVTGDEEGSRSER